MTQCKEGSQRDGLMLDSNEELYKWFTSQVMRNLHVVFTMNPSSEGLKDRAATSPALFNRCVLNWFGDWSNGAFFQVRRAPSPERGGVGEGVEGGGGGEELAQGGFYIVKDKVMAAYHSHFFAS